MDKQPFEIIVQILGLLDFGELLNCRALCSFWHKTIDKYLQNNVEKWTRDCYLDDLIPKAKMGDVGKRLKHIIGIRNNFDDTQSSSKILLHSIFLFSKRPEP